MRFQTSDVTLAQMEQGANADQTRRPTLQRAPLVGIAAALIAGIATGRLMSLPTGFWVVVGAVAILTAIVSYWREHLSLLTAIAVLVAVVAIGAVHVRLMYFRADSDHIVSYADRSRIFATLVGQVVSTPTVQSSLAADHMGYRGPVRTGLLVQARKIRTDGGWREVTGLVHVSIDEADARLVVGQQLELVGVISRYSPPGNPGQYDTAAAARSRHTLVRMSVPSAEGAVIIKDRSQNLLARAYWHVRAASRQHLAVEDRQAGRLLGALIVGERHPALRSLNRTMVRCGVAHFMSISGLHLGVFLGFVYLLCRMATLSPRSAAIVVLVVLGGYVVLAEPRAPLLRSAIMAAALCASVIARRRYVSLNSLALAAIILLAIDPLQLFTAGFQLSFTIVCGLIVLHRPMRNLLFGRFIRRRGLMVFRNNQRVTRWLYYRLSNVLMDAVSLSLAAYILGAPLAAMHFGLASPYAPLMSVLLFLPVVAVLVPGYISLALAWPMPNLSSAIADLAGWAAKTMASMVEWLSRLPGVSVDLRPVSWGWTVLCYLTIAAVLFHRRLPFGRAIAGAGIVILAGLTVATQLPAPLPRSAELNILSVGNGQCVLLRMPSGPTVIMDGGTRQAFDAGEAVLKPFLRENRLPAPEIAFISHADSDHYNALGGLVRSGRLRRVYVNDYFGAGPPTVAGETPSAAEMFMALLRDRGVEIRRIRAGDQVRLDDRTHVEVLWPPKQKRSDLAINDTSLVLRVVCDDRVVLVPGDLDEVGQAALTAKPDATRCDALIMPHHGRWNRKLPQFVAAASPGVVLVSGRRQLYSPYDQRRHSEEFYNHLRASYPLYVTGRDGWLQVRFGRLGVSVRSMR